MTRGRWRPVQLLTVALCGAAVVSCAGSAPAGTATDSEIVVFAAASLRDTFTEIGSEFQAEHPGVTVRFNFAGSSDLVAQLQQGAPADVFASADEANMDKAVMGGVTAGTPEPFATNTMTIAVPNGNPEKVERFADLARVELQVVVCAPQVPCGAATVEVERRTGVDLQPVSEELSVTDVLGKVRNGQADAGVVYRTDVQAASGDVTGVPIPVAVNAVNTYPIVIVRDAAPPRAAEQFRAWVLGPRGQEVLAGSGFGPPRAPRTAESADG